MSSINTSKLSEKLERIIDFRVGERASKRCPIIIQGDVSCPATDGTQIFLPRKESHFVSERDNELSIANSAAHEADHIREYEKYFGAETEQLREQKISLFQELCQRNYSELKENPALASWIENIVEDRRIDAQRKEQLPGVKRYYKEVLDPAAEYFRPSIKSMSKLDAFREQYLQKCLIGRVVEPILEKHRALLEEVISITLTAYSITRDKEVVNRIYQLFKENFDIHQTICQLPQMFGTGDHSQPSSGQPQQGYGKEVKPRDGREDKEKKPKRLDKGKGKSYKPNKDKKESNENKKRDKEDENIGRNEKDRASIYQQAEQDYGIKICIVEPQFTDESFQREESFKNTYAGEIESLKRIFRQLQLKHYGEKRDFQGQELDYADYMQSELEARVTGIKGNSRYFKTDTQNQQRPAWAVLADITPSTEQHNVIEQIRAGLFINAESLGVTDWPIGLFGFSDHVLYIVNDFSDNYSAETSNKIINLRRKDSGGTYLAPPLRTIGKFLRAQREHPKGITIISDGEDQDINEAKKALREVYEQKMYPFLIVIGREFEKYAKQLTEDIGPEHYSIIDRDKIHELPGEIFRLFKTYGIAR